MEKNDQKQRHRQCPELKKLLRIMKLTTLLLFVVLFQVSATSYSQVTHLNLKFEKETLENVFNKIEGNSEFSIFYKNDLIRNSSEISGEFKNALISEILDGVLKSENLSYIVKDRLIIIVPKGKGESELNSQQQKSLTGKVTDKTGVSLTGVSVVIKGTNTGTITDVNGNYSLSNIPANAILKCSFIGMKIYEVPVGSQTKIDVVMEEETLNLDEVVVIGYGTVKKQDLTGSVASLSGNVLTERKTMKVAQALQGAISGVTVTRSGDSPGSDASISIRGITTIGTSTPYVLIDGVPGSLSNVNPNDIENISVLKDAASASIYGSKAAAGVILVTTKRAKTNQFDLNYNFEFGFDRPTTLPTYLGAAAFMRVKNEEKWNDNKNTGSEYPTYSQDLIENYSTLHAGNPDQYPETDWLGLLLNDKAPRQSHRLSFTAGAKNIRTKVSIADDKTDGMYNGVSFERITIRANNDITINKYLSASVDLNYIRSLNRQTAFNGKTFIGQNVSANYAAFWSDGRVAEGQTAYNPVALIKYGGFNNDWTNLGGGKITIDLTPVDGLKISGTFAPNLSNGKSKMFKKAIPYTRWNEPDIIAGYINMEGGSRTTSLAETRPDGYNYTAQFIINYQKAIGDHNVNLMAGYENYYSFNESMSAFSDQYKLQSYPYLDLANANYLSVGGSASEYASRSFFGRILYDYKNKYLFQANARYDGSSRFYKDYRWGLFPSFSAGWVISKESFLENVSPISFLKIRASWGSLGNERIGTYPYQSTVSFGGNPMFQGNSVTAVQNASITKFAIQDISWETTESFDIGLDVAFFDNKLSITGDYYKKTTKDMLLALEIPDYMGLDNPDQNTGKMNTNGWEFEIRYNNKLGDINYSVSCNLSDFKSVMGDLGGTQFLGNKVKFEGSEFNEWYGYKSDGIYQSAEELVGSPVLNTTVSVGDIRYVDISGPEGVPDGKITPDYDRVLLGGSLPRYLYGGNVSLDYKGFDFSMAFQGVGKQNSQTTNLMIYPENSDIPTNLAGNYWSYHNTAEQNLGVKYPRLSGNARTATYNTFSDYWLFNGAYFRLKNITLGYSLPSRLANKVLLKNARIYASVSDLFSVDNYLPGWDPETTDTSYWITSSFIMGISVNF
jgi:TonB-linked SusC/RagA family outer membrane protein